MDDYKKSKVEGFRKTKPQPKPEPKVTPKRSWGLVEDVINALNKARENKQALVEIGRDFGIEYKGDYEGFNTAVITKAREII